MAKGAGSTAPAAISASAASQLDQDDDREKTTSSARFIATPQGTSTDAPSGTPSTSMPPRRLTAVTQVATFKYANGPALATIRPDNVNRTIVTLDQVPEHVRQAVLSAEDRSFYSNPGFDLTGIGRALWNQATGGVGGGSTITQQYVKVSTGQDQASLLRKYKEIVLAV